MAEAGDAGGAADAVPPAGRREHPVARWLTTTWCLAAGGLLSVAPHAPGIWNGALFASAPQLQELLWTGAARWGISGFGVLLLACGAWDVSRFIVEELG